MNEFSKAITLWYQKNKRELPWRHTKDPYKIWISEIILQQTRVEQGLPYYFRFIEKFPDVKSLALAHLDDVLRLWQGLGYYSRGRNLHHTAQTIVTQHKGEFPTSYKELILLKGIGDYTAAAISSFCANEAQAVLDGNVYRVLARYFGITSDINSALAKKEFKELAQKVLNAHNSGLHNQAIMEFGALQCVPRNPNCWECPLSSSCFAYTQNKVADLPYKSNQTKVRDRFFYYLVIQNKNRLYIKQRTEKDIWAGLYNFPLIESAKKISEKVLLNSKEFNSIMGNSVFLIEEISPLKKHKLSHQNIHYCFILIKCQDFANKRLFLSVTNKDLDHYPKPIILQKYYLDKISKFC